MRNMRLKPSDDIVNVLIVHGRATLTMKVRWKDFTQAARSIQAGASRQEIRDALLVSLRDDQHMERETSSVMLGLAAAYIQGHPAYEQYAGRRHFAIEITETPGGEFSHNFRLIGMHTETEFNKMVEACRSDDESGYMILRGR